MARPKAKEGSRGIGEAFTPIVASVRGSAAWAALNPTARALFIELRALVNHKRPEENNGRIFLSVRDAAKALNVSPGTAQAAFHDLQRVGLIMATQVGHLGAEGHGKATTYRLADCAAPGFYPEGSKEYKRWSKGNDFPIQKGTPGPGARRAARVVKSGNPYQPLIRPVSDFDTFSADPYQNPIQAVSNSDTQGARSGPPPVSDSDTHLESTIRGVSPEAGHGPALDQRSRRTKTMAHDLARRVRDAAKVAAGWRTAPNWQTDALIGIIDGWMDRFGLTEAEIVRTIREASMERWCAPDTLLEFEGAVAAIPLPPDPERTRA